MSWSDSWEDDSGRDLFLNRSVPRSIQEEGEEAENDLIDAVEKRQQQVLFSRSTMSDSTSTIDTLSSPFVPASRKTGASVLYSIAMKRKRGKQQQIKGVSAISEKDSIASETTEEESVNVLPKVNISPQQPLKGKALFKNAATRVQGDIRKERAFSYAYGAITEGGDDKGVPGPRRTTTQPLRNTFANQSAGFYPIKPKQVDRMMKRAEQVAMLFEESTMMSDWSDEDDDDDIDDNILHSEISQITTPKDVETATTPFIERVKGKKRRKKRGCCARLWKCFRDQYFAVQEVLNPRFVFIATCQFLFFKVLLVMVPCIGLAYYLYYRLGNPELQFLPGSASISWWLIFFVRQMITLQLAIIIEHTFCDIIALRSTLSVKILGPLLTLALCNAEGWPFIVTCWGLVDLVFLHGNQRFIQNWFYFLEYDFLNNNLDNGLLESDLYLRILISIVIIGAATIIKRTHLALYFGKRMFLHFRGRLEEILVKITVLSQLAQLADITEDEELAQSIQFEPTVLSHLSPPKRSDKTEKKDAIDLSPTKGSVEMKNIKDATSGERTLSAKHGGSPDVPPNGSSPRSIEGLKEKRRMHHIHSPQRHNQAAVEQWEEPVTKANRLNQPLISDILHFRKALWYLKGPRPFTDSFGPAHTREHFLHSAVHLYERLQKFLSDDTSEALLFEVISAIAYNDDGLMDKQKEHILRKLFRPDNNDEVSLNPFVHSCDSVYKELRIFLAAVENASQIDAVLERVANGFFVFFLTLLLMTVLDFDPWSLLLSVSSLLVSFSFAVGPSVSTYVSGVLLIAVRRPYDIGDRIVVNSPTSDDCFKPAITWLVEDVNLSYTTLRFASTNEVATVSNGSLAQLRIHNGNREPNALVTIPLFFRITTTHEEIELFFSAVKKFIGDNSLIWNAIVFFRTETADTAMGYIQYNLRVEHSINHQAAPQIMLNKGVLIRFCIDEMLKRDIYYISSHKPVDVYLNYNETGMESLLRNPVQKDQAGGTTTQMKVTMGDVLKSSDLEVVPS